MEQTQQNDCSICNRHLKEKYRLTFYIKNKRLLKHSVYVASTILAVILTGLEPITCGLEGSCSIQLSYRTILPLKKVLFPISIQHYCFAGANIKNEWLNQNLSSSLSYFFMLLLAACGECCCKQSPSISE